MIWEKNLDRFDTTCPTWTHPCLSSEQLSDLLFRCYEEFYLSSIKNNRLTREDLNFAYFNRYAAAHRMHPMSGGMGQVILDGVSDYLDVRKARFGIDAAPLPNSLKLSTADETWNRPANWSQQA